MMENTEKSLGFLFPGQGSQYVGMGADLYGRYQSVQEIYDHTEEILDLPIKRLSFEGPEHELRHTNITQVSILVHSISCLEVLRMFCREPSLIAGHSLGEYTALYAANALSLDDVLYLVKARGEIMHKAGKKNAGAMAAVIGLDVDSVELICQNIKGTVVVANLNTPTQTVISGTIEAVEDATKSAKEQGAARIVKLSVSGAFHSPFLRESAEEFAREIDSVEIKDPEVGIVVNVSGKIVRDAQGLKKAMKAQLASPVQWISTIETMRDSGIRDFLEIGPGRVLCGLTRRIDSFLTCTSRGTVDDLKQ